jgi:hypothetical protein
MSGMEIGLYDDFECGCCELDRPKVNSSLLKVNCCISSSYNHDIEQKASKKKSESTPKETARSTI